MPPRSSTSRPTRTNSTTSLFDPAEAAKPDVAATFAELKAELARLQKHYGDAGRFADPTTLPQGGVEGDKVGKTPLGVKTAAEAIAAAG